jgi:hypothetical protein
MMRRGCLVLVLGGLWGCPEPELAKPACTTFPVWADADGDGWGGESLEPACELAEGQVDRGQDCDDDDDEIHPDADEVCDGVDNNCNGELDDGLDDLVVWYTDADEDGFGARFPAIDACADPGDGWADNADDCDDGDPDVNPAAPEVCNGGVDDDCNGLEDDLDPDVDPSTLEAWYIDNDGDTYGSASQTVRACDAPAGFVDNTDDCADNSAARNPDAVEVCNGVDDDCDGLTDDGDPDIDITTQSEFYVDNDNDGYGQVGSYLLACRGGNGRADNDDDCNDNSAVLNLDDADGDTVTSCDGDCNDFNAQISPLDPDNDGFTSCDAVPDCGPNDPTINPAAPEIPADQIDQDCDGVDDCFRDADEDRYGSSIVVTGPNLSCRFPGVADNSDDCDDSDPIVTVVKEWYADGDGDGVGAGASVAFSCLPPFPGASPDGDDCNDSNDTIYPGAPENCFDAIDQDCNGSLTCCDPVTEVDFDGRCYYLDGSGGSCDPGYELAPQSVLNDIATDFVGLTYKNQTSNNCCIWHADQQVELQDWGMGVDCNQPGIFDAPPTLGGAGCTNALNLNNMQLTFCQTQ